MSPRSTHQHVTATWALGPKAASLEAQGEPPEECNSDFRVKDPGIPPSQSRVLPAVPSSAQKGAASQKTACSCYPAFSFTLSLHIQASLFTRLFLFLFPFPYRGLNPRLHAPDFVTQLCHRSFFFFFLNRGLLSSLGWT